MENERRVVVTGLGTVCPVGNTVDDYWKAIVKGKSGIGKITKFDASDFKTQIAGEIKNFDPEPIIDAREAKRMDLFSQYALYAAAEAIEKSGLDYKNEDSFNIGVIVGSGIGGINVLEKTNETYLTKGHSRVSAFYISGMITDMASGHIAMSYGFRGPNFATTSACASGAHAIGSSYYAILRGDADVMITGGSEGSISPTSLAGFTNIKALSRRNDEPEKAARPFDIDRDGFVMSEGAGIIVLEELDHALKRGATILAEMTGAGYTADAYHITAPHPEGIGAARAMENAIARSGKTKGDVDYINCHCPSTPAGDAAEVMAIKTVFGDRAYDISLSSTKSMIGHLLGAAGAIEFIATVLTIKHGIITPTINCENQDPACDLNCTPNVAVEKEVNFALSNSFGFGGHNATLALQKYSDG
ncbi:MAG: beta-ketoacyl-ACP synthase II [Candidatus Latescibacteria bacterium]|nr:beta-ketoacyl-ACP synthase II [Candidatus Latescibacterota bacterium]